MRYIIRISSNKNPRIVTENECLKTSIDIDADDIPAAISKVQDLLSEENVPNSFLPLSITIEDGNV